MGEKFDLLIIGAGPGGYVAAIKAAQEGLRTAVAEARDVGGTCLNRGCIPAKAMLHASSLYQEMREGARFGVTALEVSYDYEKILAYKEETTETLRAGVERLFQAHNITLIRGKGRLHKENKVVVTAQGREEYYLAENVLLATGSKPSLPPIDGMDLSGVLTSDELFKLTEVPESLTIIGGGVISVEFAAVFQALGTAVTIVEAMPKIVPNMDKEISQNLKMIMKKRGVDIHTSTLVQNIEKSDEQLVCTFFEKEKEVKVMSQYVLCAVGRAPDTEGLFDDGIHPLMERGFIVVDEHFKTSIPGVYAVGDVIKGMQLAHTASAQGMHVAEELAGTTPTVDLHVVPACIYTNPEIASAGLTEEQAKDEGIAVKTGKFVMSGNGKTIITKEDRGFVKVVADAGTEGIIGAQLMCARATDMIGEFVTAIANKLTVNQMIKGMRAHPTYNEAVVEALEEISGSAIHAISKKR